MTNAPEKIWIEIDGDDILIHNNKPNLLELISTGFLLAYIRKDRHDALLKQVREDALREAADACCHPTNVESGGESAICRNRVLALIEKDKTDVEALE